MTFFFAVSETFIIILNRLNLNRGKYTIKEVFKTMLQKRNFLSFKKSIAQYFYQENAAKWL